MRSTELLEAELKKLRKAKQNVNKAASLATRAKRRVDQRLGARIIEIDSEIRGRALRVFDAIVGDQVLLERCEQVIGAGVAPAGWGSVGTASDQGREAAE